MEKYAIYDIQNEILVEILCKKYTVIKQTSGKAYKSYIQKEEKICYNKPGKPEHNA